MNVRRLQQVLEGAFCVAAPVLAAQGAAALAERWGGALVTQAAIFLVVAQGVWMLTLAGFIARWAPDPRAGLRKADFLSGGTARWAGTVFLLTVIAAVASGWFDGYATPEGRLALGAAALLGTALVGLLLNAYRSE